jgi:hypothetical protein
VKKSIREVMFGEQLDGAASTDGTNSDVGSDSNGNSHSTGNHDWLEDTPFLDKPQHFSISLNQVI